MSDDLADRTSLGIANDLAEIARNWNETPIDQLLARLVVLVPEASHRIRTLTGHLDDRRTWPRTWWPEHGSGAERILAERHRVLLIEQITNEHDDEHQGGELAIAAACYALAAGLVAVHGGEGPTAPEMWPLDVDMWKPSDDPIRLLEKAGQFIAAEIDRLRRAENGTGLTACTPTKPCTTANPMHVALFGECFTTSTEGTAG